MARRVETELTIRAVDRYSSVLRGMNNATGAFADRVRSQMGQLQAMRGPLRLIEDFRRQQQVVRESGAALQQARERVRQLHRAITNTRNPTAAMRREFDQARRAAARLEDRHEAQRRTLSGLHGQLRRAGVNTSDLAGEQRRLAGALDQATGSFSRQMQRMERLERMQTRIAEARERMDRSLATAANMSFAGYASMRWGRATLAALRGPVQTAIDFETAMADVRRVIDFESPEAYQQMSDDIMDLSTRIPVAAEGLAQILAAGARAGVPREELLRFTEEAARVGVAIGVSADQAGSSITGMMAQLQTGLPEILSLMDAVNHVTNNMRTEAPELLEFASSGLLAAAQGFGFAAHEAMAFGSALIAGGAPVNVAATSFRNMGRALTRGASATDRQREAMAQLGLESEDVARRMQEDAAGTTLEVLERLAQVPEHLRPALISDLFGDEARALAPLLENTDLLRQALDLVSDEQQYADSVAEEYAGQADTTANRIQLMNNQLARLAKTIGDELLPPLRNMLDTAQGFLETATNWAREHPKLTRVLVYGAAAVGALAVAGGVLLTAAAGLIGTMAVLRFGLVSFGARAAFAAAEVIPLAAGLGRLGRVPIAPISGLGGALRTIASVTGLRAIAGGLGVLVGVVGTISAPAWVAVGAAVAGIGAAWRYWDRISAIARGVGQAIAESLQPVLESFRPVLEYLSPVLETASAAFSGIGAVVADAGRAIRDFVTGDLFTREVLSDEEQARLQSAAADLTARIITGVTSGLGDVFGAGQRVIQSFWDGAQERFSAFLDWVRDFAARVAEAFGTLNLANWIAWPEPPEWLNWLMGREAETIPGVIGEAELAQLPPEQQQAVRIVGDYADVEALPTPDRLQETRDFVAELRAEIARLSAELEAMPQPADVYDMGTPAYQQAQAQRAARLRELEQVERQLVADEAAASDLTNALQVLGGADVTPEINTASVYQALTRIRQIAEGVRASGVPAAGVIGEAELAQLPVLEQEAARIVVEYEDGGATLPTDDRVRRRREEVAQARAEVAALQAALDQIEGPVDAFDPGSTEWQIATAELEGALSVLEAVERQLAEDEAASDRLASAMQALDGLTVRPEVNMESFERALTRIRQIAAEMRSLNAAPGAARPERPRPAGARAGGGPVRMGLPYLVNERTPRSEWFVPSASGGVLNVGQAQAAFRSYLGTLFPNGNPALDGMRVARTTALLAAVSAVPVAASPVAPASGSQGRGDVRVEIASIQISVPSGVTDPEAIADLVADRIGARVSSVVTASFSD